MHQLKSTDYRKAIAEVVLKDFNSEIHTLRDVVKLAKDDYITNLGGTEINREKIECIRGDLNNLFTLSSKNKGLVFNVFTDLTKNQNQGNQSKVDTYKYESRANVNESRGLNKNQNTKSFFNFLM